MKVLSIIAVSVLLALTAAILPSIQRDAVAADKSSLEMLKESTTVPDVGTDFSDIHEGYLKEEKIRLTCGGNKAGSDARMFHFGFRRLDGYCGTRDLFANSANEAWICARGFCSTCTTIEDITDRYSEDGSVFGSALKQKYCAGR